MRLSSWMVHRPGEAMRLEERSEQPEAGEVLIAVAGCGVCHTDLGFFYDGVETRHPLPLCLGHEISGRVVESGPGAEAWLGRDVIVPAVIPCGACDACLAGRGAICPKQIFPGNDVHGGFASHVKVPARGLCPVPDLSDASVNPTALDLAALSVIADAVSTPYQAISRSALEAGDLAVFVGVGGVGSFGVQIAAAMGARVVALDVDPKRLRAIERHGASMTLRPDELSPKEVKAAVRAFAVEHDIPSWRHKIFESSGTAPGQTLAFSLIGPGSYLGIIGFTRERVEVRLANLMAFDAVAAGNWGCPPEHYPDVLSLVLHGKVRLEPFIERRTMARINETFDELRAHSLERRPVLIPED